jgi:hypothetical protein
MVRRVVYSLLVLGVLGFLFFPRAGSDVEKQSIIVQGDRITVINTTDVGWSDVEVWLNDHYRGQERELARGQRLDMPIRRFVAGFGQTFDPAKQAPYGIEVTAKAANGEAVRLSWGKGRRR